MVLCNPSGSRRMVLLRRYTQLLLSLAIASCAFAQAPQQAPDCGPWYLPATSTDATSTVALGGSGDNRAIGCDTWTVMYQSTGFTGVSLTFQSAPGVTAIGTWVSFAGTTDTGANPMVSTSGGTSTYSNPTNVAIAFVRLNADVTGTGTLSAVFYGYRTGSSGGGGGGGGSGCTNPCIVIGPEAPGAAATEDPVQVSGVDMGGDIRRLLTDGTGGIAPAAAAGADADGVSNSQVHFQDGFANDIYTHNMPYVFNGSTWDRQFKCSNTLRVNVAATGPTEVIPLTAGQTIRVCSFTVAVDAGGLIDMSFVYGTGVACGTGTTTIAGPYDQITYFGPTFSQEAPLTIPAGNALCLTNSAATAVTGVVIYAKY